MGQREEGDKLYRDLRPALQALRARVHDALRRSCPGRGAPPCRYTGGLCAHTFPLGQVLVSTDLAAKLRLPSPLLPQGAVIEIRQVRPAKEGDAQPEELKFALKALTFSPGKPSFDPIW